MIEDGASLREALRILLKRRRAELNPAELGISRATPVGRRAAGGGLSQTQVDDLLGFGRGTYERLESGRYREAPEHVLKAVGELFELTQHEWVWLWRMTWRRDPPFPLRPDNEETIPASWHRVLDGQPHPAYLTNHRWEVVAYNQHFPQIFPGRRVPPNTMEWMLLSPDARYILGDWANSWAPFVAPHLWAARAAYPDDAYLKDLERRALADPELSPIYKDFGPIFVHPDGATRPFNHPEKGPGWITLHTSVPLSSPRFVTMLMIFDEGPERPKTLPPLRARYGGA
ncbi:MAG: helix-turn-helix domain-containing protein [Streptomyces sp.]|nr:helix-turn-helix domain-containing protein [Streptomyces sp.]NUS11308.1 helix-turn-helix domain-containing protein [Streptomyces sp.]NUS23417.1 helix-turn-helix domain-containing protein [Streptomyces sp.]